MPWHGRYVRPGELLRCLHCGEPIVRRPRRAAYCSDACKQAAYRARKAFKGAARPVAGSKRNAPAPAAVTVRPGALPGDLPGWNLNKWQVMVGRKWVDIVDVTKAPLCSLIRLKPKRKP